MSLVIPVALPGLMPAVPSLAHTAPRAPRRSRNGRPVAVGDRERFRRRLRGVRSYRPSRLAVNAVAAPDPALAGLADEDLEGLGRFRGFRGITKALPRPKSALMMATLGPAALLNKSTRKDMGQFMRSKQGALAMAALAPIGAPALLMTKQGRGMLPGFNKFANSRAGTLALGLATPIGAPAMLLTKKGRSMLPGFSRMGSMFGGKGGGGGGDEGGEAPPDPGQAMPADAGQPVPMDAGGAGAGYAQYETGPYMPPAMAAELKPWQQQSPPFVAMPTPPAAADSGPIPQATMAYEPAGDASMPMPEPPTMPGDAGMPDPAGEPSADAGPLVYDPAMSLYQAEPGTQPADEAPADG